MPLYLAQHKLNVFLIVLPQGTPNIAAGLATLGAFQIALHSPEAVGRFGKLMNQVVIPVFKHI